MPSDGPAFGLDVGVTNLRLAFASSIEARPEVREEALGFQRRRAATTGFAVVVLSARLRLVCGLDGRFAVGLHRWPLPS